MLLRKWWDIELIWFFSDPWTIFVNVKLQNSKENYKLCRKRKKWIKKVWDTVFSCTGYRQLGSSGSRVMSCTWSASQGSVNEITSPPSNVTFYWVADFDSCNSLFILFNNCTYILKTPKKFTIQNTTLYTHNTSQK